MSGSSGQPTDVDIENEFNSLWDQTSYLRVGKKLPRDEFHRRWKQKVLLERHLTLVSNLKTSDRCPARGLG